jgi:hypothetical protein
LLDFGRSDLGDEGLRSFKESLGAPEEPLAYATVGKAKAGSGAAARLLRSLIRVIPTWLSPWVGARSAGSRLDRHPVFPCPNGELPNATS